MSGKKAWKKFHLLRLQSGFSVAAPQKENRIRELVHAKNFLAADEAEIVEQKYVIVLVGSLETPAGTYWIECLSLESCSSVNSGFILHNVEDILRQLGT